MLLFFCVSVSKPDNCTRFCALYQLIMASRLRNKDNENEYAADSLRTLEMRLMMEGLQRRE